MSQIETSVTAEEVTHRPLSTRQRLRVPWIWMPLTLEKIRLRQLPFWCKWPCLVFRRWRVTVTWYLYFVRYYDSHYAFPSWIHCEATVTKFCTICTSSQNRTYLQSDVSETHFARQLTTIYTAKVLYLACFHIFRRADRLWHVTQNPHTK